MTAEQHALAILNAIQAAEKDGFQVSIEPNFASGYHLEIGDFHQLYAPRFEDEGWEIIR